ncbi:hypothetical protein [Bdellovibrio sp. HCB337]|uniref:hypothetical protein n=1 Tax=Bdellovibrio sp. HCB337 TaxID=3394358 RepID=UPI0039A4795C
MIFFTLLFSWSVFAGEPDNFSARLDRGAVVANKDISFVVNTVLERAIFEANRRNLRSTTGISAPCNKEKLNEILDEELDQNFPAVNHYLNLSVPYAGPISVGETPYRGDGVYKRKSFVASAKVKSDGETYYVGIDKVDHMFSQGSLYWRLVEKDANLPDAKIKKALELGMKQEQGPWGLKSFGVKSYADLAANYHGLFFWRDLLNGPTPMIVCRHGQYYLQRKFEIENYLSPAMDETINCNSYKSEEILQAIKRVTDARRVSCPVSAAICTKLKAKYPPEVAKMILHPICLGTGTSQVEEMLDITTRDLLDGASALLSGDENLFNLMFPPEEIMRANQQRNRRNNQRPAVGAQ